MCSKNKDDDDRGYHAVRFEYKTASERYLVAEI